jgi:hypothetical protein
MEHMCGRVSRPVRLFSSMIALGGTALESRPHIKRTFVTARRLPGRQ